MNDENKPDNKDSQENENIDKNKKKIEDSTGAFLAVGIGLGVSYGIIFDNLAIGISLGVAFGLVIGSAVKLKK